MERIIRTGIWFLIVGVATSLGCAYRPLGGPLVPSAKPDQMAEMRTLDDGTLLYAKERLEIGLRPLTDEQLNRQFPEQSQSGVLSANPYTYGDWKPAGKKSAPSRFAVFHLTTKNYTYPKVRVNPLNMIIVAENGRKYSPLSFEELKDYYVKYVVGYAGNANELYENRKDMLRKTLYPNESEYQILFSGQEQAGYVVFPPLDDDVSKITIFLDGVVLRFDSWNRPAETMDLAFRFERKGL